MSPAERGSNRRRGGGRGRKRGRERWTKLSVRGLPSSLGSDDFKEHVTERLGLESFEWFHYIQGKTKNGEEHGSVALVAFRDDKKLEKFQEKMQDHVFVDGSARQFRVRVERYPLQRVPQTRKKDPMEGTLQEDEHYQEFVRRLEEDSAASTGNVSPSVADRNPSQEPKAPVVTALMEYLQKRHEKRKKKKQGSAKGKHSEAKDTSVIGSNQAQVSNQGKAAPAVQHGKSTKTKGRTKTAREDRALAQPGSGRSKPKNIAAGNSVKETGGPDPGTESLPHGQEKQEQKVTKNRRKANRKKGSDTKLSSLGMASNAKQGERQQGQVKVLHGMPSGS